MKRIFLPLVVLLPWLVVVPVGAEERLFKESDVRAAVTSFAKEVAKDTTRDRACLAQMREAMKAMDTYLPRYFSEVDDDGISFGRQWFSWAGYREYSKVLAQWDVAKQACWGKP